MKNLNGADVSISFSRKMTNSDSMKGVRIVKKVGK